MATNLVPSARAININSKIYRWKFFEVFHRAGNVCKIQGTGLGLAIVKRCVDLQKGQIHFESQEGIGTTFTVILPRNLMQPEHEQALEDYYP